VGVYPVLQRGTLVSRNVPTITDEYLANTAPIDLVRSHCVSRDTLLSCAAIG